MIKQVLTSDERKSIRSDIYREYENQPIDYNDGKINFFIKHCKNNAVLDLGSVDHFEENHTSKYWLFKAIYENCREVQGIDYYLDGVNALKKHGYPIEYGDAQNFTFPRKFDVVTAGDLIEHLPNLDGFITSISKVLNPNGKLLISTPNPWCWKYLLYHVFYGKLNPVNKEHVSWFCLRTIENLFSRYGFKIVEYQYSSRRRFEKLIPLPKRIKHTTLNLLLVAPGSSRFCN